MSAMNLEVERLVRRLPDATRRVVTGRDPQKIRAQGASVNLLIDTGIAYYKPKTANLSDLCLTPLGLAVRARLEARS